MNLILYFQLLLVFRLHFAFAFHSSYLPKVFYRYTKNSIISPWQLSNKFPLNSQKKAEDWSYTLVPASYSGVENDMLASLNFALKKIKDNSTTSLLSTPLLSIDVLTPGLNPKLEQKAYLPKEKLFDLVHSIFPVLNTYYKNIKILFPSTGDAAGFQSYCTRNNLFIPETVTLTDLSITRLKSTDDCCVFVTAKNLVGDPVIREIQKIAETFPQMTGILLNCDLSDRVASGLKNTEIRNAFRSSIVPVYYFRNIIRIERPSLEPTELGALLCRTTLSSLSMDKDGSGSAWELFACERGERMLGPGSLNRYLDQPVFRRQANSATGAAPPRFIRVATLPFRPDREELNNLMSQAESLVARLQRKQNNDNDDEGNLSFEEKYREFDYDDSCENIAIEKCLDLFQSAVITRSASYERVKRAVTRIIAYKQQQQVSSSFLTVTDATTTTTSTNSIKTSGIPSTTTTTTINNNNNNNNNNISGFDRGLEMLDFNFEEKKTPAKISTSTSLTSDILKSVKINRDPLMTAKDTKLNKYPFVSVEDTVWKQVFVIPSNEVMPTSTTISTSTQELSTSLPASNVDVEGGLDVNKDTSTKLFGYTDNKYLFRSVFRLCLPGASPFSRTTTLSKGKSEVRVMVGPIAMITMDGTYTSSASNSDSLLSTTDNSNKRNALSIQASYEVQLSPAKGPMATTTSASLAPTLCWQLANNNNNNNLLDCSSLVYQVDWLASTTDFALSEITPIFNNGMKGTKIIVLWSPDN